MTDNWQPEPSPWLSPASRGDASDGPGAPGAPGGSGVPAGSGASPGSDLRPGPGPEVPPPPAAPAYAALPPPGHSPVAPGGPSALSNAADPMATQMVAVGTIQPRAPRPPGGTIDEAERILGRAVDALTAAPSAYSIGATTEGAVCLVPEGDRWSVFLAEGGLRRFAGTFDDPEQAAVHFAGVLLLAGAERGTLPKASGLSGPGGPGPDPGGDPFTAFLAGPPIEPLAGDPPTALYAERRLTVLPPGTELDRFGDQEGNTVYAARTRYPNRSLPPDYVDRDYRVYRVHQPVRAVVGTAVPWFGQPGGGVAYLLPRPIRDLLREGVLTEIPSATVAPR